MNQYKASLSDKMVNDFSLYYFKKDNLILQKLSVNREQEKVLFRSLEDFSCHSVTASAYNTEGESLSD